MRRLALALGVIAAGVFLVWWLRRPDAKPPAVAPGSAAVTNARAARPQRAPMKPASLAGKVTRKADGAPVAGAVVSLSRGELGANLGSTTPPTIVVTSDAAGAWEAKDIPPGEYMVAATAKGLLPQVQPKLTLASEERRTGVDFALDGGGTLVRGTVSDVGGGPIASARVTARRAVFSLEAAGDFVALTGADGTYELTLPDAAYGLKAEHDDYTRVEHRIDVAGKPITRDFTLIPGGVIRGQVIARDTRKPVPGALVSAESGRGRFGRDTTAIADADGNFVLRGLGSGTASIEARGRGYASASPTTVALGIGEQVEDIQVLVDGAYSISGRVVKKGTPGGKGDGIGGARLGAFSMTGGGGEALEPSDPTGAFEIAGLRPGGYMLFAGAENTVLEIGKNVEIVDHDVTDVVVELATGVKVTGRVEPPVAGASVVLELDAEIGLANMFEMVKTLMVRNVTDASGAFTLVNVPPGKFRLAASTKDGMKGKLPITVGTTDQTGAVIALTKRASIAGRVVDTNGKPVADVQVTATPDDEKGGMRMSVMFDRSDVRSGPDGAFKIVGLDPGKYEVHVQNLEAMIERKNKDKDKKRTLVELAEGADRTGVTVTIEARDGVLRGVVMGADGKPAADAWVTAHRELEKSSDLPEGIEMRFGMTQSDPVLTGADGRFTITKLRAGTYTLVAEGPRGASRAEKQGVKTGDSATLQLAALGTLVVTVTQRGAPTKSYDISCESPAHEVERHATTEDGTYKLENLPPGEYKCNANAETGTAEGKVTVPTGETKLALALSVFGSLSGQVVSVLSANPVPDLDVIVNQEGNARGFLDAMTGKGIKTDAQGKFVVERVPAGKGKLLFAGKGGMSSMESHDYTAKEGERVDLGQIKIIPPRTTEAGTFGFSLEVKGDALEVTSVSAGSPAEAAGIVAGDKIVAIEGIPPKAIGLEITKKLLSSGTVGIGQTIKLALEKGSIVSLTSVKW